MRLPVDPMCTADVATGAYSDRHHAYDVQGASFCDGKLSGRESRWVLSDVSLHVEPGEILGIVGPNGSGKTSLVKLLAKLAVPQRGTLSLFGRNLADLSREETARTVAFVPQESPPAFSFTVAETVLMGRYPHRRQTRWSCSGSAGRSGGLCGGHSGHGHDGHRPSGFACGDRPVRR